MRRNVKIGPALETSHRNKEIFYENKQIHNRQAVRDMFHSKHAAMQETAMSNKTAVKVYRPAAIYSYILKEQIFEGCLLEVTEDSLCCETKTDMGEGQWGSHLFILEITKVQTNGKLVKKTFTH